MHTLYYTFNGVHELRKASTSSKLQYEMTLNYVTARMRLLWMHILPVAVKQSTDELCAIVRDDVKLRIPRSSPHAV